MEFLILVGTAREGRKTIRSARAVEDKFEQSGHEVEFFDLKNKDIPPLGNRTYVEDEEPVPEDIEELSRKVDETDCLVIVSPEYNHSIPGVLKNALDYLYPEYDDLPFAYVADSAGGFGGVRAISHLHDITIGLGGLPGPSLPISNVGEVFDENGEILEESYHERIERFVGDVEEHVEKFGQ
jgi:NAD(P)H-dependent FMN reductase